MAIQFDIVLLRYFTTVAETGGMSRAAKKVGRTQSALSQQIKKLENSLDQILLIRSETGIRLTACGEQFLVHAKRILQVHDEAVAALSGDSLSGTVRLGCPDDYAPLFLPTMLRTFAEQYPQVLVEVVCAPTPRLLERLHEHVLDIAIVSLPDGADRSKFLRREPLVWVGAVGSDAAEHDPVPLALSDLDTLDYAAATTGMKQARRPYRIICASRSISGLSAAVRSGQAITVFPRMAVPPDLRILSSPDLPALPHIGIGVITAQHAASPLLARFESDLRSILTSL